jgi:hypothetical protein
MQFRERFLPEHEAWGYEVPEARGLKIPSLAYIMKCHDRVT